MYEYRLSVIIPCYNAEKHLPMLFQQLECCRLPQVEVLIINDGSTDKTEALCRSYAEKDARVRVISQPNGGVSRARNIAIQQAQGCYLFFMDCDDTVDWESLSSCLLQAEAQSAAFTVFGYKVETRQGNRVLKTRLVKPQDVLDVHHVRESLLKELFGISREDMLAWYQKGKLNQRKKFSGVWSHLYKRDFLSEHHLEFHTGLKMYEDGMFNCECAICAPTILLCDEIVYSYIRTEHGAVSSFVDLEEQFANKMLLVKERQRIESAAEEKHGIALETASCGSEVLSFFQLLTLVNRRNAKQAWRLLREYGTHIRVRHSVMSLPLGGAWKFRLPFYLLKRECYLVLVSCALVAKCLGVSTQP